ncbi:MAG TPA: DoxX family protein [Jatrophihabitantaceae bacterium]|jgi:putative oxidoreductase|nr:DoxX family protein [Jatrophihabitantaceae bacterium]
MDSVEISEAGSPQKLRKVKRVSNRRRSAASGSGVARLLLRGSLGATMIAHGVRHGKSIEGTAGWFESIGFRSPKMQAMLSSGMEVGAGAALITGMATPLAASAVVGTMAVAGHTVHKPNGFFITDEGYEYVMVIGVAAVALGALGPGRLSVDRLLGLHDRGTGVGRAAFVAGLGLAGAAAQLKTFWRRPAARPA